MVLEGVHWGPMGIWENIITLKNDKYILNYWEYRAHYNKHIVEQFLDNVRSVDNDTCRYVIIDTVIVDRC